MGNDYDATAHCLKENCRVKVRFVRYPNGSEQWICQSCGVGTQGLGKISDWRGGVLEVAPKKTKHAKKTRQSDTMPPGPKVCHYCNADDVPMTRDHIVPRSKGGANAAWNYVWACGPDNVAKGNTWPTCQCERCQSAIAHNAAQTVP